MFRVGTPSRPTRHGGHPFRDRATDAMRRRPAMKSAFEAILNPFQRRFAALGLLGALAVTVTWWFIIARGVWMAVEWASA